MMDMVVTRRVNAGMEEAFEAIARQQTSCVLRQPMNAPIWLADPTPSPSPDFLLISPSIAGIRHAF
jgi:hypothetical protein